MAREGFILLTVLTILVSGCGDPPVPKPRSYFRLDVPHHEYQRFAEDCPFSFDHHIYSGVLKNTRGHSESCWYDIYYPEYQATIHLSYKAVDNNIDDYIQDAYTLVAKHTVKATNIVEDIVINPQDSVFGLIYNLEGDCASSVQFYLTDSTNHFVRGALYFNARPNYDSLQPVISFIQDDIRHLANSFNWKGRVETE